MKSQISIRRALGAAMATCLVLSAGATTLVRMDLDALVRSAEFVVRARCLATEARWESGAIWTFAQFEVLESFKGAPPRNIRVRLPGGRAGNLRTRVDGVPEFVAGEEIVLFVERTSAGDLGVTSWAQGTFRVRRDAVGESHVTQDTSHFAVFDPSTRQFSSSGIRNMLLSELRQKLGDAFNASATTPRRK
jgi:hypothetical protein